MATTAPVLESHGLWPERRRAETEWRHAERRVATGPRPLDRRRELEALFLASLPVIDSAIAHVVRRHRLSAFERDDFASEVHLAFVQNDYRILARFQGHSSLRTYLIVVVQRLFIDSRRRAWGKWRPSTVARQLGPVALRLEALVHRDGCSVGEAVETLCASGGSSATRDELSALARRLPPRAGRRLVGRGPLRDATAGPVDPQATLEGDATAACTQAVVTEVMDSLSPEERLILRCRFEDGLSVAAIARAMRLDQKSLYRRIGRLLARFRRALDSHGIAWADLRGLVERGQCALRLTERTP